MLSAGNQLSEADHDLLVSDLSRFVDLLSTRI